MEFEKRKAATLVSISSTEMDKSPKGTLDEAILPLIKSLNLHPSYFTTSSCSGRISILCQPITTTTVKKKARGGSWLYITHEPADPDSVVNLLFSDSPTQEGELVFRFEPFILAVECKDLASAQSLVSAAISCGFRESGITNAHKRVIIAIRCSIRLEVPLGLFGEVRVSPGYVRYLVGVANDKLELNRKRTECFLQVLESKLLPNEVKEKNDSLEEQQQEEEYEEGVGRVASNGAVDSVGDAERMDLDTPLGSLEAPQCSISVVKMAIVGEPVDKLFLWGHSSCTLHNSHPPKVLIFGGFGGLGRHARRNDTLMLDPLSGILEAITVEEPPSPRLGHTSSMIGESLFVIGGHCDHTKILNDVWVFNTDKKKWVLLKRAGVVFHPREKDICVGRKIYVFGGLRDEIACSSMHVLDTENSEWSEINVHGEWPCDRHSHAMVANDSKYTCLEGMMARKHSETFVKFRAGLNTISLLSIDVGLPNVGPHFETWNAGVLGPVMLNGLNEGRRDLTWQKWSYKIGLEGEALSLDTISGGSSVEWVDEFAVTRKPPLTWYKTTFNAPPGNDPLALDMGSMGKGQIWVNGQSIGRHWPAYKASGNCDECSYAGYYKETKCQRNCGQASQQW